MLTIFWLVLVAIMLVIEIFTLGLTTIWFSLGGVAAAIAAGLNSPLWLQIVLFAGVSVVVMILVRPFAVKVLDKSRAKTNIDELPGPVSYTHLDVYKRQELNLRFTSWIRLSMGI